ncbi:PREDICTED: uncharacterized protein LOC109584730 [Amphimedon queenslandica]|uniref:MARVEL domain-containing protein n=1 Tax=Amphimedon queenslandica TaxID=400682 RepID=A0A1X7U5C8_AMPQE|nr:PREDICTED: uncharacterized protein LOC109584730 [Amphimedon queenslandica]|eukprot:XP_019856118.1 PREDICTED: uncharacterized protein LOC109584730 [Amphimedon queenslandica]
MSAADQAVQSGSYTYTATVTQTTTTRTSWFPSIKPGFDHTYFRSIEGMLRVASLIVTILFFILTIADYRSGGEWYNGTLALWWIVYAIITIIIEVVLIGIFVHRLIDGIICFIYAGCFVLAVLIAIVDAARFKAVVLGVSAAFGVVATILILLNAIFALRTWKTHENGKKGSVPIFII